MVYAIARLPQFIQRLEYAVYREDEHRLDPWIAATFATFLSSKDAEKTVAGIKATAETTYSAFIQKDLLRAFIGKSTIPLKQKRKQLTVFKLDDKRRSILAPSTGYQHPSLLGREFSPKKRLSLCLLPRRIPLDLFRSHGKLRQRIPQ